MPTDYAQSIENQQCQNFDELTNYIMSVIALYKHHRKLMANSTSFSRGIAWQGDMFKSKTFRVGATGSNITVSETIIVGLQNCLEDSNSNEGIKKQRVLTLLNNNKSKYTRWGKGRKMIDAAIKRVTAYMPRIVAPVQTRQTHINSLSTSIHSNSMLNDSSSIKLQKTNSKVHQNLSHKKIVYTMEDQLISKF
ncbi:MAG: hypothetical protein GY750_01155 [Lentisphaerae bacterium]|nr:hypothetical protein [Lentisphaerota bacterium]MCP4100026.1 hypothetical protein [Lentisphaerota bacterium]